MKKRIFPVIFIVGAFLAPACGGGGSKCRLDPGEGPSSGYYPVTIRCPGLSFSDAEIPRVRFGENAAIKVEITGPDTLSATVQGSPAAGKVDVVIGQAGEETILKSAFKYAPPADPLFDRMFAIGASWTMGAMSGSIFPGGQLNGPAAQLARRVGAYLPLPVVKIPVPEPVEADDLIGHCTAEELVHIRLGGLDPVLNYIAAQGELSLAVLREDPDIQVHDLAVGGSTIHDVIYGGGASGRKDITFAENLVYFPHAPLSQIFQTPEIGSQLEVLETLSPSVVIITDLFANDLEPALFKEGLADPSLATSFASFQADARTLLARLAATGAEVFIANLGNPIALPWLKLKLVVLEQQGYTRTERDGMLADIEEMVDQFSGYFTGEASKYSSIHIVDLAAAFKEVDEHGLAVGAETLTTQMFGGMISLDGIHPSRTGYAFYANIFLQAINQAMGLDLPMVDLEAALADDPFSPGALRGAGLDPDQCGH